MRVLVTGATGFLGGRLTEKLLERGDEVVALVRREVELGAAHTVRGDLSDPAALREAMQGCGAVFHVAAMYEVGIPRRARDAMYDVNVRGTENVLDAAANIERVVYVSTVNVFGNTHGTIVDETYERTPGDWLSAYDWTKYLAHQAASTRENVAVAQPGAIYGPGDHSELGAQLDQARRGKLPFKALADVGVNAVHVDDAAAGLLLVHDRGRLGESYVLGSELTRLDAKARRELGYDPRDLKTGLASSA